MKANEQKKTLKNEIKPEKKHNIHDGHRDRMRERFSKTGFEGMQEHEILEMLLYYSVPRRDTNPIAHNLIDRFGSLAGVLEAKEEQLLLVDGITQNSATLIKMILPMFHQYSKKSISGVKLQTSQETGEFLCDYYTGITNERVMVICLDASCKMLAFEKVCDGDSGSCLINCRKLIEIILKYPLTVAVILAHNHPGGVALPSREDVDSTVELIKMLRNVNINLVAHFIIVKKDDFDSMASSANFKSFFY